MEEKNLGQRLHIDFPLFFGILILCALGLVVIYSAGGQDIELVYRQATKLVIALAGMVIIAQFIKSFYHYYVKFIQSIYDFFISFQNDFYFNRKFSH